MGKTQTGKEGESMSRNSSHRPEWIEAVTERAADPEWRRAVTETATQKLGDVASEITDRASDVGAQVSQKGRDLGQSVAEKIGDVQKPRKVRRGRHPIRTGAIIAALGTGAAYVLRRIGQGRGEPARTSGSARHDPRHVPA